MIDRDYDLRLYQVVAIVDASENRASCSCYQFRSRQERSRGLSPLLLADSRKAAVNVSCVMTCSAGRLSDLEFACQTAVSLYLSPRLHTYSQSRSMGTHCQFR